MFQACCPILVILPDTQQADAPNPALIPQHELLGVTVVLLTCSYRSQEFFRVGYYVNNDYSDAELLVCVL